MDYDASRNGDVFVFDHNSVKIYKELQNGIIVDATQDLSEKILFREKNNSMEIIFGDISDNYYISYQAFVNRSQILGDTIENNATLISSTSASSANNTIYYTNDVGGNGIGALKSSVRIRYVNEENEDILPSKVLIGSAGFKYETIPEEIEGYVLKKTSNNKKGIFTPEEQIVLYAYKSQEKPEESSNETSTSNMPEESKIVDSAKKESKLPQTGQEKEKLKFIIGILFLIVPAVETVRKLRGFVN